MVPWQPLFINLAGKGNIKQPAVELSSAGVWLAIRPGLKLPKQFFGIPDSCKFLVKVGKGCPVD